MYTAQVFWLCFCLNVNKCAFPETYLLKYQPSPFIFCYSVVEDCKRLPLSLLILSNFSSLSVLKLIRKWWRHQNVRRTMGFSYFVLEVLLRITEMFIHVKTSENWFFSIVKGFRANFDHNLVTEAPISVFFRRSTVVILLLFLTVTGISQ